MQTYTVERDHTRRRGVQITLALILGLLPLLAWSPPPAWSASLIVDTLSDENDGSCTDGDCSLRDALATATPGDSVEFNVTGTITLTLGELTLDKELTVAGPGAGSLTVSGGGSSRVFWIEEGVNATLSGLTIADGLGQDGGGIFNRGGLLTLQDCTLANNRSTYDGGGVSNRFDGTLTVSNCLFSGNRARNGAAIDNRETLIVSDSTFTDNSASTWGGAIYNFQGVVTVSGSRFTGNGESTDNGGGICNDRGVLEVSTSDFSANRARLSGAGIYSGGEVGRLLVTKSSFYSNTTARGGAIYNAHRVTVDDSTFTNNRVPMNGGALHNGYLMTVTHSTFFSNSAQWGGAIENYHHLDVSSSTFYSNTVSDTGGGICSHGALTVTNSTFYSNTAGTRGGGINNNEGTLRVVNATFSSNGAHTGGGGIHNGETTTLINTIVANSTAGGNCSGSALEGAGSHNLATDGSCSPGFTQTTQVDLALSWEGWIFEVITGSVAIDAGTNAGCPAEDQLGHPRPQDGDGDGSALCDVGSHELSMLNQMLYLPLVLR